MSFFQNLRGNRKKNNTILPEGTPTASTGNPRPATASTSNPSTDKRKPMDAWAPSEERPKGKMETAVLNFEEEDDNDMVLQDLEITENDKRLFELSDKNNYNATKATKVADLLRQGARWDIIVYLGRTALHNAASYFGSCEFIKQLVDIKKEKVNINIQNAVGGNTPLHFALHDDKIDCLNLLLKVPKMNVNLQNNKGRTALHVAAEHGQLACVTALLNVQGVHVNAKTLYDNKTPLDLALKKVDELHREQNTSKHNKYLEDNYTSIIQQLKQHGGISKDEPGPSSGGKKKNIDTKEYKLYKGKKYLVRIGKKGGKYILVGTDKKKIYI